MTGKITDQTHNNPIQVIASRSHHPFTVIFQEVSGKLGVQLQGPNGQKRALIPIAPFP